ncbi:hypothetical protein AA313_de0200452 [Arthrobotrys entomopaga]|nr:hypothetical protein AA313_de0200452 [Arthrobotrys entomopaga]
MMASVLKRPALGQTAFIGSLYDTRTDCFTGLSLFRSTLPENAIDKIQKHSTDIKFVKSGNYRDKFNCMDLNAELGASFLAGMVSVAGSGRYLDESSDSNLVAQCSMQYNVTTTDDSLNLTASGVKECLAYKCIDSDIATHFVVGISWGARCVVTAKQHLKTSEEVGEAIGALEGHLKYLGYPASGGIDGEMTSNNAQTKKDAKINIKVYGDILVDDNLVPTDLESAQRFIGNIHRYISTANDGKGVPLTYTLMPLSFLSIVPIIEMKTNIILHELSHECLEKFAQLFEEICETQKTLKGYIERLKNHQECVPLVHIRDAEKQLRNTRTSEATLKSKYSRLLKGVRRGDLDSEELWKLLEEFQEETWKSTPEFTLLMIQFEQKMELMDIIAAKGAHYIGYRSKSIQNLLTQNRLDDALVFYFNGNFQNKSLSWDGNFALLLELLQEDTDKRQHMIIVVDCDATGEALDKVHISKFRNAKRIVNDVLERREFLAANCRMRYAPDRINRSLIQKPLQRRVVKIPCPNRHCDKTLPVSWICSECEGVVEYGHVDDRLYCNCGSCQYEHWEFRCKDPEHGSEWTKYPGEELNRLLQDLEAFPELNILLLGETGVGKSTWINAFVNYLTHDTLQEALEHSQNQDLKWVVPCSFSTQVMEDSSSKFVQKSVKIGTNKSEKDGSKGESATQSTTVYAIDIDKTRVRLIDTPGIGDTRGIDQDNENMVDILRVLRSYNKLHGVLILLKPNATRLTVMFRFCIKQLLTHLHRNAANNIVFGFTNTRGSNYMPGDTFKPLESLLHEYTKVSLELSRHNVYCFDSESFRYLAAHNQRVDIGYMDDNARSWEHSVLECKRLVKHFEGLKPHEVRSTINLNETRDMILQLTKPMAHLNQKIESTIQVNEDQIKDLNERVHTREELKKQLYVQIESMESVPVDMPRTICTNGSCVEVRSDFEGRHETTIVYKTVCHSPCYLNDVDAHTKGHHSLRRCWAINADRCRGCTHSWEDHMHIYNDYQPKTYRMTDKAVETKLGENATDLEIRKQAIRMKKVAINEFKLVYDQVEEAAIQFGFFLKRHAILPYNDATIEYINLLIDQENLKIAAGGSDKTLKILQRNKQRHEEKIKALTDAMAKGTSKGILHDQGVHQTIESLYDLPNFGGDLRQMVKTNEKSAEGCYREQTYHLSAGVHWKEDSERRSQGKNRDDSSLHYATPPLTPKSSEDTLGVVYPLSMGQHQPSKSRLARFLPSNWKFWQSAVDKRMM